MNKCQEALDTLCDDEKKSDLADSFSFDKYYTPKFCDDIAIEKCREPLQELVDRAAPKKPIERHYENDGENEYIKITCPAECGVQVSRFDKYCPNCGQALDWSEDDE